MVSGPSGINVPGGVDSRVREWTGDTVFDAADYPWLVSVLNTLLPANEELPGAGDMGLGGSLLIDATWSPDFVDSLEWIGAELPAGFDELPEASRVATLSTLEALDGRQFANIMNLAYNAYYTDARVLSLIERETGFTATPPQPNGYDLEPFDPAILATTSQREPFWRKA
jgi:hypothetical protein